ncbi:MAG: THUMP domain-containing protein [Candidatus Thorarchaeota archaeon]
MRRKGLQEYNLLIGCPREREKAATSEVQYFIGDLLGDSELRVSRTPISGLLACRTALNPIETVHRLKEFAFENPYQFRFAVRFTPLEFCVRSDITEIVRIAEAQSTRIKDDESFRVTVRRRHTTLRTMEVISAVAAVIPRRVDLDNPDKTLFIEIVGDWTGISLLRPEEDILSIRSMRDDLY